MIRRLAMVMCVVALSSGCAIRGQAHAVVAPDDQVPFALLDPNAPPLVPPTTGRSTEVISACFVRDGKLVSVAVALDPPAQLSDVVAALVRPPASAGDVRTALGEAQIVRSVSLEAGTAHVDLNPSVSDAASSEQVLAVAQLVCSLTARPGVGRVAFTLGGAPVDIPRGDGSLTNEPVSRDDYRQLLQ